MHINSSDDEDSSGEDAGNGGKSSDMTFQDLVRNAVLRSINKGQQFLSSGRVLTVLDCRRGDHTFLKAQVQASMESVIYVVFITLATLTGIICDAACCCKGRSLNRCGHIAAVLLLVWKHVCVEGYEAITTTGRQCYWKTCAPGKNPGFIREKQYPSKKDIRRRVDFDPAPAAYKIQGSISASEISQLKEMLIAERPTSLLLYQLGDISTEYESNEFLCTILTSTSEKCSKMIWELNQVRLTHTAPFELPDTRTQKDSVSWFMERAKRCTASSARTVLGLSTEKAFIHFLRRHVWSLDKFQYEAMAYGQANESVARKAFMEEMSLSDPDFKTVETGLWVNPKFPTLACSPDGLLLHWTFGTILVEIKVISNPAVDPRTFDTDLTGRKLQAFYLRRDEEDHDLILLKRNHAYYYQIQLSLDILELDWCHLVVWSERGHVVVPVERDPAFWTEKRLRLVKFQREVILPEIILQRTKRYLPPIQMTYSPFHEDEHDTYFSK